MSAASGYSENALLVPGSSQDVTIAGSGRISFAMVLRSQVIAPSESPGSGSMSFAMLIDDATVEREPIPAAPERWDTPRYRFVGG